jgi:uncharacterized protein DUF1579
MKAKRLVLTVLLIPALLASCASTKSGGTVTEEQMMARMTEFSTPGEAHKVLDSKVGTWNLTVRMFMSPDQPPQESHGSSSVQWILDGRYLQDTTVGEFGGMPFRGSGLTGYDNLKKRYVSTWIDNFGTGILHAEGRYDASTRTFHYESEGPDLMFANAYVPTRAIEKWIDADHWVMQSFGPDGDGDEYMAMEIQYARVR